MLTRSPAAIEKLFQFRLALAVPCWMFSCAGALWLTVAWPDVRTGPWGRAWLGGPANSMSAARLTGRSTARRGVAGKGRDAKRACCMVCVRLS